MSLLAIIDGVVNNVCRRWSNKTKCFKTKLNNDVACCDGWNPKVGPTEVCRATGDAPKPKVGIEVSVFLIFEEVFAVAKPKVKVVFGFSKTKYLGSFFLGHL